MLRNSTIRHVLIIDDDPILREILATFIEQNGVTRVSQATSGDSAIRMLDQDDHQIDLIFCDLNMPGKDGVEVLSHLHHCASSIPIIIVSSAEGRIVRSARELARAYSLNLIAALHKPVNFESLGRALSAFGSPSEDAA